MTELYCPECAEDWNGTYTCEHRCVTCGTPLKSMPTEVTAERQLASLRADVRKAREWAGDNLPADTGLVMVQMLEKAMRGGE